MTAAACPFARGVFGEDAVAIRMGEWGLEGGLEWARARGRPYQPSASGLVVQRVASRGCDGRR